MQEKPRAQRSEQRSSAVGSRVQVAPRADVLVEILVEDGHDALVAESLGAPEHLRHTKAIAGDGGGPGMVGLGRGFATARVQCLRGR